MRLESSIGVAVKMIKLKDLITEGGPGSGKKKTGRTPKLQDPWNDPAEPVKHTSKLSRKSRSKEWNPQDRPARSTKGKRAPKLENGRIGEAYGKPLTAADIYSEAVSHLQEAIAVVHLYMGRQEDEGNISQADPKLAQSYKSVQKAGMAVHVQLKKWKSVMEGVEKIKHQQRGK